MPEPLTGTGDGKQTTRERINAQFSFTNIWHRLGRVVVVSLGGIVTLGHLPNNVIEWCGYGITVAGAIWTNQAKETGD